MSSGNKQHSKRSQANKENEIPNKGRLPKTFKIPNVFGSKVINKKMDDVNASLNKNEIAKVFRVVRDAIAVHIEKPTSQELVCVIKQMLVKHPCLKYMEDEDAQIVCLFLIINKHYSSVIKTFSMQRTYYWILQRKFGRYRNTISDEISDEPRKRGRPKNGAKKSQSPGNVTAIAVPQGKRNMFVSSFK